MAADQLVQRSARSVRPRRPGRARARAGRARRARSSPSGVSNSAVYRAMASCIGVRRAFGGAIVGDAHGQVRDAAADRLVERRIRRALALDGARRRPARSSRSGWRRPAPARCGSGSCATTLGEIRASVPIGRIGRRDVPQPLVAKREQQRPCRPSSSRRPGRQLRRGVCHDSGPCGRRAGGELISGPRDRDPGRQQVLPTRCRSRRRRASRNVAASARSRSVRRSHTASASVVGANGERLGSPPRRPPRVRPRRVRDARSVRRPRRARSASRRVR